MYSDIAGAWRQAAGATGTVTLPSGARLLQIVAVGGGGAGSIVVFGDQTIPVPAGVVLPIRYQHGLAVAGVGSALTIVFTGTASFYVEYVESR